MFKPTHEYCQKAIERFRRSGGKIKKLSNEYDAEYAETHNMGVHEGSHQEAFRESTSFLAQASRACLSFVGRF